MFADQATTAAPGNLSLAGLRGAWARYRLYRRAYAELNALSTRELNDLGISRCMISRLAREAAQAKAP